jgi:hypothetical protein
MTKPLHQIVMLNLIQHPFLLLTREVPAGRWTLKQVQGDDAGQVELIRNNPPQTGRAQQCAISPACISLPGEPG